MKKLDVKRLKGYRYTDKGRIDDSIFKDGGGSDVNLDEFIAGNMVNVTSNLEIIPDFAFSGKSNTENIELPNATYIGKYAFSVDAVNSGASGIGSEAEGGEGSESEDISFHNKNLTHVSMDNVTHICKGAFAGATNLEIDQLPDSILVIEDDAFKDCSKVQLNAFPPNVVYIGDNALPIQENIDLNTVPDSLVYLGSGVDIDNVRSFIAELCSYDPETNTLDTSNVPTGWFDLLAASIGNTIFPYVIDMQEIVFPDNLQSIGDHAFYGSNALTSLVIPDSVTSISNEAFTGCYSLTSLTLPENLQSIGNGAFNDCNALESLTLPENLESIGDNAFNDCNALESLTLPENLESIGNNAFDGCNALASLVIPDSVTSIGNGAFSGCDVLTDIYYSGTQAQWESINGISSAGFKGTETIHYESTGPSV